MRSAEQNFINGKISEGLANNTKPFLVFFGPSSNPGDKTTTALPV
jgi:hypothetical protein